MYIFACKETYPVFFLDITTYFGNLILSLIQVYHEFLFLFTYTLIRWPIISGSFLKEGLLGGTFLRPCMSGDILTDRRFFRILKAWLHCPLPPGGVSLKLVWKLWFPVCVTCFPSESCRVSSSSHCSEISWLCALVLVCFHLWFQALMFISVADFLGTLYLLIMFFYFLGPLFWTSITGILDLLDGPSNMLIFLSCFSLSFCVWVYVRFS